ncbi:hypothetical protein [Rhizobium jaguaris]|uniref:Peptidase MA-like domain-containing protein n=1 Tax=Rhizobium jaguaris TaxID=1312183 RepID=A0A387G505_9HYPH|nr:hypothetical protein [Rhizobium jaguaris]AYG64425.1 hypothetical protein CCGE525_37435 [Rhizobium jaguaris]
MKKRFEIVGSSSSMISVPSFDADMPDHAVEYAASELLSHTARLLGICARPVVLFIIDDCDFFAATRQCRLPSKPVVCVSADNLRADVIAHEFVHALLPTNWLFLAEGFAGAMGCHIGNDCSHLLFESLTPNEAICHFWSGTPTLEDLIDARVGQPSLLSAERFIEPEGRMAHLLAASFCGFCLAEWPEIAVTLGNEIVSDCREFLARVTGTAIEDLFVQWEESLAICK